MNQRIFQDLHRETSVNYPLFHHVDWNSIYWVIFPHLFYYIVDGSHIIYQLFLLFEVVRDVLLALVYYLFALLDVLERDFIGKSKTGLYGQMITLAWHSRMRAKRYLVVMYFSPSFDLSDSVILFDTYLLIIVAVTSQFILGSNSFERAMQFFKSLGVNSSFFIEFFPLCTLPMCLAKARSAYMSHLSRRMNMRSNLEKRAAGRLIFFQGVSFGLYLLQRGLAAARMEVLAFKVVVKPALAIEMVCCSMTSWMAVLSYSSILSNSSMQHTPISAKTKAPASRLTSLVTGSILTAAVKPTSELPLPVVQMPRGADSEICFNNCDLATPGSPTNIILIYPLILSLS